jgi:hypothetical protein
MFGRQPPNSGAPNRGETSNGFNRDSGDQTSPLKVDFDARERRPQALTSHLGPATQRERS